MRYDTVTVRWSDGEVDVGTAAAENSRHGFIEDSSLTSESAAIDYGTQWLAMHADTVDQVDVETEPDVSTRPWSGVAKGDAVLAWNRAGEVERERCVGVGFVGLRRNGVPKWSFTIGSAAQQRFIASQRQLSKLTEGSAGGSFGAATPRIAPSYGDLPTSALPRTSIPLADTKYFVAADDPVVTADNTPDRTNPYPFDDAQSLIRVECACESLVGSGDSVVEIWRVAYSADGTEIAAGAVESFTWPDGILRFTYVTEILFLRGQAIQLRTPAGGVGSHRLITIQPITSSPN